MKLYRMLTLGLLIFSCFDFHKTSGSQVPPGLECFSAEELQQLEQDLKAGGKDIEAYMNAHPEEWAKFCDTVEKAESKANPVNQKTEYNPYKFGFSVFQYDEKTGETVFIGGHTVKTSELDYAAYLSASYPPLYWAVPSLVGDVRNYIEYVGIGIYKRKDDQNYMVECNIRDTFGLKYPFIHVAIPQEIIEKILVDTRFDYTRVPLNRYGTEYVLATRTFEELTQPQFLSAFNFMAIVTDIALKYANLPELLLDKNDLKTKFNFRRKWLSWDTWKRWFEWL